MIRSRTATAKANELVVQDALRELLAGGDFGFRDRGIESLKVSLENGS